MNDELRGELDLVGARFHAIALRFGAPDLHMVAVEPADERPDVVHLRPPIPMHIEDAPLIKWRHAVYLGHRLAFWYYYGDPALMRGWDALCYHLGEIARRFDSDLSRVDADRGQSFDWMASHWWPFTLIDLLDKEEASTLIRRVEFPDAGPTARAIWFGDDLFNLSAAAMRALTFPWVDCSQSEVAEFLDINPRAGLLEELAGKEVVDFKPIGRTKNRVRFLNRSDHSRFRHWVAQHQSNAT